MTNNAGMNLQLPKHILDDLSPDANKRGVSQQVLIKRILRQYYQLRKEGRIEEV